MESFEILAEVAVGLAGFGSVAIMLGRGGAGGTDAADASHAAGWDPGNFFRTSALFLSTLGALFLALLPIGLATSGLAPPLVWRGSSAVMLVYLAVFTWIVLRWRKRYLERSEYFGPGLFSLIAGTTIANAVAQLANALGFAPNPASYFFGVVWFLLYGCLLLMRIVFIRQ